jgi:hypothetical protein
MNKKPDRTMLYIAGSVILLVVAIAATSIINNRPSSEADIRAKASLQTGLTYEAIVNSVDASTGTLIVENLKPTDNGMALTGTWSVTMPSDMSLTGITAGTSVQITIDSKTFNIQTHTLGAKKVEVK